MRLPLHTPVVGLLSVALSLACAESGPSQAELAKAEADKQAKEQAEFEAAMAKRKAEREAEEKAAAEAEAAANAALEQIAVLPASMPKNLEKACDAVTEAEDAFMKRHFEGETLAKWESAKGTKLPMTRMQCLKVGSLEVAACQKNALDNAPAELKEKGNDLLRACTDKFAKAPPPGAAAVPPRPPGK